MRAILKALVLWSAVSVVACGEESDTDAAGACANVSCGDYGSCNAGACTCTDGYTGTNCETAPVGSCAGVNCGTHGSCTAGVCVCTDGYTGSNCETPPSGGGTFSCDSPSAYFCQDFTGSSWTSSNAQVGCTANFSSSQSCADINGTSTLNGSCTTDSSPGFEFVTRYYSGGPLDCATQKSLCSDAWSGSC